MDAAIALVGAGVRPAVPTRPICFVGLPIAGVVDVACFASAPVRPLTAYTAPAVVLVRPISTAVRPSGRTPNPFRGCSGSLAVA